jgi:gas vesicle protein
MSQENNGGMLHFLAGAVLGGVIGAGVALLFAPQSGKETRKMIKEKVKDVGEELNDFKEDLGPKFQEAKENLLKRMK